MFTFEETVYRPPLEAGSALLEIALGCSYGKCTFCQYADGQTPLQLVPPEILCANLAEMAEAGEARSRIFLLGGNVLAFQARYLLDVFRLIRSYLPGVEQFSMYARADDVAHKTDAQLKALRDEGLSTLYIGVESGNAQVLRLCRKGETPEEITAALHRLDALDIPYGLSSILGLGGAALSRENALDTAALYNQVHPVSIRIMTLTPMAGTPLESAVKSGAFRRLPPRAILEEELVLLENLTCAPDAPCRFVGSHVSNAVPLSGTLPMERERLVSALREAILLHGDNPAGPDPPRW